MNVIRISKAAAFFLLCLMISCEDILVEDLSDKLVVLIAPADSVQSHQNQQQFLWEAVEGATQYELFVFSPDFLTASAIVLDTVIEKTSFTVELPAAKYEWCVTAGNGVYKTAYACRKLEVVEELSDKQVTLLAPAEAVKTSETRNIFWWDAVAGATEYKLSIVSPSLSSISRIALDTVITETSFAWDLTVDKYEWCVKASNGRDATESACRKMEVIEE